MVECIRAIDSNNVMFNGAEKPKNEGSNTIQENSCFLIILITEYFIRNFQFPKKYPKSNLHYEEEVKMIENNWKRNKIFGFSHKLPTK